MELADKGLGESCFCLPRAERNRGVSLGASLIPARGDLGELKALILAPGEEAPHHTRIGAAGVGIGDPGGEELIGGEEGLGAGALEDSRDRSGRIEGLGGGQKGGLGRGTVYGDLANDKLLYRELTPKHHRGEDPL